jgi:hypothetical protein
MDKNTIAKALPTIALRDHVAPDTPLSERPPVPKSLAASKNWNLRTRLPFDRVVLLLQGGGALGSYQAGVYEALSPRRPLLVRNQVGPIQGARDRIMIAAQQKLSALRCPLRVIRIMEDDRVA